MPHLNRGILQLKDRTALVCLFAGIVAVLWLRHVNHVPEDLTMSGHNGGMDAKCKGFSDNDETSV